MRRTRRRARARSALAAALLLAAAAVRAGPGAAAAGAATPTLAGAPAGPAASLRGVRWAGALLEALALLDVPAADPARSAILRLFASGAWPLRADRLRFLATDPVERAPAVAALERLAGRTLKDVKDAAAAPVVTREDAAAWAAEVAGIKPSPGAGGVQAFADAASLSPARAGLVAAALEAGLLDGTLLPAGARRLEPSAPVTLAQFALLVDLLRERGALADFSAPVSARVTATRDEMRQAPDGPRRVRSVWLEAADGGRHRVELEFGAGGEPYRDAAYVRGTRAHSATLLSPGDRVQFLARGAEVALFEEVAESTLASPARIVRVGRAPARSPAAPQAMAGPPGRTITLEVAEKRVSYPVDPRAAVTYNGFPARWVDVRPGYLAAVTVAAGRVTQIDLSAPVERPGYASPADRRFSATLIRLEGDVLTVRDGGGRLRAFWLDGSTRVLAGGEPATPAALQVGDTVTVQAASGLGGRLEQVEVAATAAPVEAFRGELDALSPDGRLTIRGLQRWDWGRWSDVAGVARFDLVEGAAAYANDVEVSGSEFAQRARGRTVYLAVQRRDGRDAVVKASWRNGAAPVSLNGEGYREGGSGSGIRAACCTGAPAERVRVSVGPATVAIREGRLIAPAPPAEGVHYFAAVVPGEAGLGEDADSPAVVLTQERFAPPDLAVFWGLIAGSPGDELRLLPYRRLEEHAWGAEYGGTSDPLRLPIAPAASLRDLGASPPEALSATSLLAGARDAAGAYSGRHFYALLREGALIAGDVGASPAPTTPSNQVMALAVVEAVYGAATVLRDLQTWDEARGGWRWANPAMLQADLSAALVAGERGRLPAESLRAGNRVALLYEGARVAAIFRRSPPVPRGAGP